MQISASPTDVVARLRGQVAGAIIASDDVEYDTARTTFLGDVDRRPLAIVRVANADDIARVVAFARDNGLDLAVRSGGHSNAGHSSVDDGIVIDLSPMKALEIDVANRTAWAETGLTAGEVTRATAEHGLAVGFGDTASVGIGGITLGGGVGYLSRKHGLTIDSLLAAEVVTADGQLIHVDANSDPDLFWAIRGGGGNFGVVTRFKYQLHELGQVVGGMLLLPATPEVIARFVALADEAPEELSAIANIMPVPPMPFVPQEHHGKLGIMALIIFAGDVDAGLQAVAPFRALAQPFVDMLRPMAYPEIYGPEDPSYRPTPVQHTMFLDHVGLEEARTIVEFLEKSDASLRAAQLRVLGGAIARVPADATAFAHRTSRILAVLVNFYDKTPEDKARRQAWVDEFAAALRQNDAGAYVNFLGDEGEARIRAAYPDETWRRLASIKARYDPANLFHLNQNIPPA